MSNPIFVSSIILAVGLLASACGGEAEANSTAPAVVSERATEAPARDAPVEAAPSGKAPKVFDAPPPVGTKATCPVMGGEFVVKGDSERSEHDGKHVVFCCGGCKPQFDKDPTKFL